MPAIDILRVIFTIIHLANHRSNVGCFIESRQNGTLTFAKTDQAAIATSCTVYVDGVTIQGKLSGLTSRNGNVVLASPVQLEQTTILLLFRTTDSA